MAECKCGEKCNSNGNDPLLKSSKNAVRQVLMIARQNPDKIPEMIQELQKIEKKASRDTVAIVKSRDSDVCPAWKSFEQEKGHKTRRLG